MKSVSVLVGGTAFSQALAILVLPLLTRLYTPNDFAAFAVYSAIFSILAVVSCLRLEIAIPLPKQDSDAISLMVLAIVANCCTSVLSLIVIYLNYNSVLQLFKNPSSDIVVWLIPIGGFLVGLYNILQYWSIRGKKFTLIAKTRATQAIGGSLVQVLLGVLGGGAIGLIIGLVLNSFLGGWALLVSFFKNNKIIISKSSLINNLLKYKKFPQYSVIEALANNLAIQLPVIIIAFYAIDAKAGYLMLAMKVLGVPLALVGNAFSQVYLAHAAEKQAAGELKNYTYNMIFFICKITIIPFVLIAFVSPYAFPLIFGKEWQEAGDMTMIMIPWFFMQILSSPVSMSLHVLNKMEIALLLQILGAVLRGGGVLFCCFYYKNYIFEYYAFSGFIFYAVYLSVIMLLLNKHNIRNSSSL